jgi:hypothetical protein
MRRRPPDSSRGARRRRLSRPASSRRRSSYESISVDAQTQLAAASGTDEVLLQQRAAFLRPDSLLLIVSVGNRDDCSVRDGGQYYLALQKSTGQAQFDLPPAVGVCADHPSDSCCASCGQAAPARCPDPENDPACAEGCAGPADGGTCAGDPHPWPESDALALRCFHEKQRFGIDFLQPVQRYVDALTKRHAPNREGGLVPNPIYADLGNTGAPPRHPGLVVWTTITGVPWQDLARDPHDLTKGYLGSDELASAGRWGAIIGAPASDVEPSDPFMIESIDPRSGANPFSVAALGSQGIAASICPRQIADDKAGDYLYDPALDAIVARASSALR